MTPSPTPARDAVEEEPLDLSVHWRCFHCGEEFTKHQERWAREHFGRDEVAQPVCLIRSAGEGALLSALREAEDQLVGYRAEDSLILRAMHSMRCDHAQALRREEERGYEKGVSDVRDQLQTAESALTAANARIREMEAAQVWQPIETAPRDGKEFVVAYAYQGFVKQLVNFNTIHHCWQSKGKMLLGFATNATHWLALPSPPSEAKDDGRGG